MSTHEAPRLGGYVGPAPGSGIDTPDLCKRIRDTGEFHKLPTHPWVNACNAQNDERSGQRQKNDE